MTDRSIGPGRAWAIVAVATATMALSYLDRQVLAVLAPTITRELEIGEEAYGWLQSAFSIAYLVGAPLAGFLLERVGVRRGLLAAVVLWSLVSAMHGFVPGFGMLFAMRLALGLAEAPSFPGSASAIARALPPHKRARGIGILYTGSSFGAMIAPPLATFLAGQLGGWRLAFGVVALAGLLWVPAWLLATGGDAKPLFEASAQARSGHSLWSTARHPAVLRAGALVVASSPVFAFIFLWTSKLLVDHHHIAQEDVGGYLWMPPIFLDIGAVTFGFLASRFASRAGVSRSPIALASVAALMTLALGALPLAHDPWAVMALCGVAMAGGGGLFAILTADMITAVGAPLAASAGGVTAAAQSLAYIVANPLIGRGVRYLGYDGVVMLLALWLLPGFLVWVWRRPRAAPDGESSG